MKNSILLIVSGLILLTGCSTEPISTAIQEEAMFVENEPEVREPVFAIQFTETGTVRMADPEDCPGLENANLQGATDQTVFGIITTNTRMCTNFNDVYELKGFHQTSNGDRINFIVEEWAEEGVFIKLIYKYDGGSGQFEGATGELAVMHRLIEMEDSRQLSYLNIASGHIRLAVN